MSKKTSKTISFEDKILSMKQGEWFTAATERERQDAMTIWRTLQRARVVSFRLTSYKHAKDGFRLARVEM